MTSFLSFALFDCLVLCLRVVIPIVRHVDWRTGLLKPSFSVDRLVTVVVVNCEPVGGGIVSTL